MAQVLVCNCCAAKGNAVFATVHAEGKLGVGKGVREFDADFCDEHGAAFLELVGRTVREKKAKGSKRGPGRSATPRVPPDVTQRDILMLLATQHEPIKGRPIYAAVKSPVGATKKALMELRTARCIVMDGDRNNARYTITKKGRDRLRTSRTGRKKKAPAANAASAPSPAPRAARRLRRVPRQTRRRRQRR